MTCACVGVLVLPTCITHVNRQRNADCSVTAPHPLASSMKCIEKSVRAWYLVNQKPFLPFRGSSSFPYWRQRWWFVSLGLVKQQRVHVHACVGGAFGQCVTCVSSCSSLHIINCIFWIPNLWTLRRVGVHTTWCVITRKAELSDDVGRTNPYI